MSDFPKEAFHFLRPGTAERIEVGERSLGNPQEKLFSDLPSVGLVISTFGAVPYVDLALAIRNQVYPELPVLVHDDASDKQEELARLCQASNATFEANSSRLGHELGDLSGVLGGLQWAKALGLKLLVKMSRRFVPLANWVANLQELALLTQFPTFGRGDHEFPLRTECFALSVETWSRPKVHDRMLEFMLTNQRPVLLERFMFDAAVDAYTYRCQEARRFESKRVVNNPKPPFITWGFIAPSRKKATEMHLWHNAASPQQYADLARHMGLHYPATEFDGYFSQVGI